MWFLSYNPALTDTSASLEGQSMKKVGNAHSKNLIGGTVTQFTMLAAIFYTV